MIIKIKPQIKTFDAVNINIQVSNNMAFVDWFVDEPIFRISGHLIIQGDEYDIWGLDDNYIYDLILQKLGYERA